VQKVSWKSTGPLISYAPRKRLVTLFHFLRNEPYQLVFIGALHTKDLLQRFPYYQNYVDLSRLESSLLNAFLLPHTRTSPLKIAFVGSGPLPLTSFCLLDTFTNATIHNIDCDVDAISQSKELSRRLGYGERMTFACEDAHVQCVGGTDWKTFDVVFLAALVGMTSDEKKSILQGLGGKLKKGCLIVCRSARGLRSVLYPVCEHCGGWLKEDVLIVA
jgi:nicotianamine synthase